MVGKLWRARVTDVWERNGRSGQGCAASSPCTAIFYELTKETCDPYDMQQLRHSK